MLVTWNGHLSNCIIIYWAIGELSLFRLMLDIKQSLQIVYQNCRVQLFCTFFVILPNFHGILETYWVFLDIFLWLSGLIWNNLGRFFKSFWKFLVILGRFWVILNNFGSFKSFWRLIESCRTCFKSFGAIFWVILKNFHRFGYIWSHCAQILSIFKLCIRIGSFLYPSSFLSYVYIYLFVCFPTLY